MRLRGRVSGVHVGVGGGERLGGGVFNFVKAGAKGGAFRQSLWGHGFDDQVPGGLDLAFGVGREGLLLFGALVFGGQPGFFQVVRKFRQAFLFQLYLIGLREGFEGLSNGFQAGLIGLIRDFPGGLFAGGGKLDILALCTAEDGLQTVEIGLEDGVELVIVATCAVHGEAKKGLADVGCYLGEDFLAADVRVNIARDQVLRTGAKIACGDQGFRAGGGDFVACQLFANKTVVGLVGIEGVDDVVAVAPGMGSFFIQFEAVGVGITDDVEPFQSPAFTIGRGGHQAIDKLFVSIGGLILQERADFGGGRRQTRNVEGGAADELGLTEGGRGFQVFGFERPENELINFLVGGCGGSSTNGRPEGPIGCPGTEKSLLLRFDSGVCCGGNGGQQGEKQKRVKALGHGDKFTTIPGQPGGRPPEN